MNSKYIFLLSLLIGLVSIGCVSGAEVTNDDVNSNSLTLNDNVTNATNFNELSNFIKNHSVVELTNDINRQNAESEIVITSDLTIDGKGHTINANQKGRIFKVKSGKLTLKNLYLINGKTEGSGGAIYSNDVVICANCTFINNRAYVDGGAILSKGYLISDSCKFENNTASGVKTSQCYGGAIYSIGGFRCFYSSFINNNAYDYAGAVYCDKSAGVYNSIFQNNSVKDNDAGAILSKGYLECRGCTFTNNHAYVDGGAIYCENKMVVRSSEFINNTASGAKVSQCYGGAIRCEGNFECYGSSFINNIASDWGGALYCDKSVKIDSSLFYMNKAKDNDGGAIYCSNCDIVSNSNFTNNYAKNDGGAICIWGKSSSRIEDSTFENNRAPGSGGAIYCNSLKHHINIHHNILINNSDNTVYTKGYFSNIDHNYFGTDNPNFKSGIFYEYRTFKSDVKHVDKTYCKTLEEYYAYNSSSIQYGDFNYTDEDMGNGNSNGNYNGNDNDNADVSDNISMEHTAIPLITIILVLFVLPIVRFKK